MKESDPVDWYLLATSLGRAFRHHSKRSSSSLTTLLVFVGAIALIFLLLKVFYFFERRREVKSAGTNSDYLLFRELCRIHALTKAETSLLAALAKQQNLSQAGEIFVNPAVLATAEKSEQTRDNHYRRLRRKLFAGSEHHAQSEPKQS